jgi:hypothetical protein
MDDPTTRTEMHPRTRRFLREFEGRRSPRAPTAFDDPETRRWKQVSARLGAGVMAAFIALLVVVGGTAPEPGENVARAATPVRVMAHD